MSQTHLIFFFSAILQHSVTATGLPELEGEWSTQDLQSFVYDIR